MFAFDCVDYLVRDARRLGDEVVATQEVIDLLGDDDLSFELGVPAGVLRTAKLHEERPFAY